MDSPAPPQKLSNPWLVLFTLLVIYIFNLADRYLITGLIGPIQTEFGLSDSFMGLLMGPAFVLLYVLCGVPIARLADRTSRVRIIAAGCVMWSASTLATGLATGPVTLALTRIGVGEAAFVAPAWSLIAAYFPPLRRGIAFAMLGNSGDSLRLGLSVVIPTGFIAAILAWLAASRIEASRERLEN